MKTLAGGGAALGAAAMMPSAAAMDIESDNPLSYNDNFSVDTQGNLDLQGKDIANAGEIGAEKVNNVLSVGPSGRFDSLSSAFSSITDAASDNRYRLEVTEDYTETSEITLKSHIYVDLGGNTITADLGGDGNTLITDESGHTDAILENGRIEAAASEQILDLDEGDDDVVVRDLEVVGGSGSTTTFPVAADFDGRMIDCRVRQKDNPSRGAAIRVGANGAGTFKNVTAIGGDDGDKGSGFRIGRTNATFHGCTAYAGSSTDSAVHAWQLIGQKATPTMDSTSNSTTSNSQTTSHWR